MPGVPLPDDLLRRLEELERRIRDLETAPRATHTSVRGGSFTVLDDAGNEVVVLNGSGLRVYDAAGVLRAALGGFGGGDYGSQVWDAAGGLRFSVLNDGYHDPWIPHAMIPAGAFVSTTSAAFTPMHQGKVELITHLGVSVSVIGAADAGTTGEFRLRNADTGAVTAAISVAAGTSLGQTFQWLHGSALGGGPVRFDVEGRRTGGAGNFHIYQPYTLAMADPDQCTSNGL